MSFLASATTHVSGEITLAIRIEMLTFADILEVDAWRVIRGIMMRSTEDGGCFGRHHLESEPATSQEDTQKAGYKNIMACRDGGSRMLSC